MQHININLIDTHFHLDLMPQPDAIAGKMQQRGISAIAVTNTPSVFHYTHLLSQKYSAILPAVGLHPELAAERKQELPIMWDWLAKTRFVGEIGLDYVTNDDENRKSQRSVFQAILTACAKYGDKVLTIHSRRSSKDVVSMIGDNFPGRIILHWYSGSIRDLTSGLSYGFFFS
ncbi:MAG: TatD family hydrolase, partial [Anaerolineae bacterium]|nr:TatD family hydrolase [Anaerolineae bacterium]